MAVQRLFTEPRLNLTRVSNDLCRYLDEIEKPMDLQTVKRNVQKGRYSKQIEFMKDVNLIFDNCRAFNGPSALSTNADIVEAAFKREIASINTPAPTSQPVVMTSTDLGSVAALLRRILYSPNGFWYAEAVRHPSLSTSLRCSELKRRRSIRSNSICQRTSM